MPTLFKEVSYNLTTLIQHIDMGIIGLPDIQRHLSGTILRSEICLIVCIKVILSDIFYFGQMLI